MSMCYVFMYNINYKLCLHGTVDRAYTYIAGDCDCTHGKTVYELLNNQHRQVESTFVVIKPFT